MRNPLEALKEAANDQIIAAILPSVKRFVDPMLAEGRQQIHKLFIQQPPSLAAKLEEQFPELDFPAEDVSKIWQAVTNSIADPNLKVTVPEEIPDAVPAHLD